MSDIKGSITPILIAAAVGATVAWGAASFTSDESAQLTQIATLESRILDLELALTQKDAALADARAWSWAVTGQAASPATQALSEGQAQVTQSPDSASGLVESDPAGIAITSASVNSQQLLRDLSTSSDRDPRSFSEKVADLMATNPTRENVAIASQGLVEMANSPELLPDYAVQALYQTQTNTDLKRVAAQVMSMRGDNSLIEKQISEAQSGLRSQSAADKQRTLVELAKTRYAGAANVIAPLLQDGDTGVKLDALLALRATGNQSHVHLVESLANHPDPAVAWLANDVISNLQNLSEKARTRVSNLDIVAELPALAQQ